MSVWLLSNSLPPSESVLRYFQIFLSLSVSLPVVFPLPLVVLLTPSQARWALCLFLCLGLDAPGRRGHVPPFSFFTLHLLPFLSYPDWPQGWTLKAHFVPDNVPALCTGLLPRGTGWADLGLPLAQESSLSTLVFRPGLLFLMSQLTLTLIIYMQINILSTNSADLFCLPKYCKIFSLSVFPPPPAPHHRHGPVLTLNLDSQ